MSEHSKWHSLFEIYKEWKKNSSLETKDVKKNEQKKFEKKAQFKQIANRYLSEIRKHDKNHPSVINVVKLLEVLLPDIESENYEAAARVIDAVGKERTKLPHRRNFWQRLFGKK